LANMVAFRRLNIPARKLNSPMVSILVPARDEEDNLRACLDSLLRQDYSNFEILVLDDNSSDGTAEILREYAKRNPRLKAFSGAPLRPGWLGKHYACQQLSERAEGEYLLFTDADTVHRPDCVSWALTNMRHHDADFMSALPRQKIGSFGEALVVPAVYLVTSLFLPVWLIPKTKTPLLSFAIGQFVIGRASAYEAVGGYEAIKDSLVDDLSMAKRMKAAGFKTLFLNGEDHVECRMYRNYRGAFNGIVKNLFPALDKSLPRLIGAFLLIVGAVLLPLINLLVRSAVGAGDILLSAVPVAIFLLMWSVSLQDRKIPPYVAFLYPLQFLSLLTISVVSAAKTSYGKGALWKGRLVK
jgi:chlorobactene glucosyltransferase